MSTTALNLTAAIKRQNAQILDKAQAAFWQAVAEALPLAKTGDFPPDAYASIELAMEEAISTWRLWNDPVTCLAMDLVNEVDDLEHQVNNCC